MRAIYLLIGFLLMFRFPIPNTNVTALPVLGFSLILFSVLRMEKLEPIFKKAKIVLFFALPVSGALLALQIYSSAGGNAVWFSAVYNTVSILTEALEMLSMFFIYIGIKLIGTNAEIPSLEKHSSRNMTLMFVYFVVYLAMNLLYIFVPSVFNGFEFVMIWPFVLGYLWRAMNILMSYALLTKISVSRE